MVNTGLLVLTNPLKISKLLPMIKEHVHKTLYIQYYPEKNVIIPNIKKLSRYSQNISNIYSVTSSISTWLDVRILLTNIKNPSLSIVNTKKSIEVVIFDYTCNKEEAEIFIQKSLTNTAIGCSFISYNSVKFEEDDNYILSSVQYPQIYKNVVLGGTFDRLHNGHKILLSEAILHSTEKLTVGVTDTNMLSSKLLWELIEPCSKRIDDLNNFLEDVDGSLNYRVVPINDMYGPTKDDPALEMIVVSEETMRGAEKVNSLRLQKKLNLLDIYEVKLLINEQTKEHEENKISSSNTRIGLLGTRLQPPKFKDLPLKPYIIGLTGGIASGKSTVATMLQNLGTGLVNCDKIAHDLYLPQKRCYNMIIEQFGTNILKSDGFIDRKILGDIVFNDKEQLNKLNKLIWPVILNEAKNQIQTLYKNGHSIIVMEAAVLIQADWQHACHEIWACIIPLQEAVKRIVKRNSLSEHEANLRIQIQPSNTDYVREANVVISTLWNYNITEEQVKKAWEELQLYLSQCLNR